MQVNRKVILLGVVGGLAGALAALISTPFVTQKTFSNGFTYGSFYGWFAHLVLGATICGGLAFAISLTRTGVAKALVAFFVGAVVGGPLTCATDALSDNVGLLLLGPHARPSSMRLAHIAWCLAVAMAMAFSVALATQPTRARLKRSFAVGLIAGLVASFAGSLVSVPVLIAQVFQLNPHDLLSGKQKIDIVHMFIPVVFADDISFGAVIGLMLGLGEAMMRQAWVRVLFARNEIWDIPLDVGPNRIGSAEGIEVRLPRDRTMAEVQAVIDLSPQGYYVSNVTPTGGTMLNGIPVRQAPLNDGDEIQVGPFVMLFCITRTMTNYVQRRPIGAWAVQQQYEVARSQSPQVPHRLIDPYGQIVNLGVGRSVIGRDPGSTIPVTYDLKVSRNHAEIVVDDSRAVLRDLGSTSGTILNGKPLTAPTAMIDGDKIRIGDSVFEYRREP